MRPLPSVAELREQSKGEQEPAQGSEEILPFEELKAQFFSQSAD